MRSGTATVTESRPTATGDRSTENVAGHGQHTPGPWKLVNSCDGTPSVGVDVLPCYGTGFVVAQCNRPSWKNGTTGSAEANAALIVRAVNSYESTLAALREVQDYCTKGGDLEAMLAIVRTAIAKAEGA